MLITLQDVYSVISAPITVLVIGMWLKQYIDYKKQQQAQIDELKREQVAHAVRLAVLAEQCDSVESNVVSIRAGLNGRLAGH